MACRRASIAGLSPAFRVVRVLEGRDGRFWIATHSGLNVSAGDPYAERPRFERYTVGDGLPSNTVYAVLQDELGLVWASTNLGVVRVHPATREVRRFGVSDGLQDLEFNGGALLRLADGRLAFGGILLTMFDHTLELTHEVEREVRDFFGEIVFETVVPRDVQVAESPSHGLSVLDYAPRSRGSRAYVELCWEVMETTG